MASTWIIGLNTLKKPFNALKVRQLFKNQISAEEFRKIFYPDSTKANRYVPHGLTGSINRLKSILADLQHQMIKSS